MPSRRRRPRRTGRSGRARTARITDQLARGAGSQNRQGALVVAGGGQDGSPAVEGLASAPAADVDYPGERLRAESGAAPGTRWIGTDSAVERLWSRPAITVTGIDAPKVAGASNTLVPVARARVTVRLAPGDTSVNAVTRLREHLEKHVPWGAQLTATVVDAGEPTVLPTTGPAYAAARAALTEAWDGAVPVDKGSGGSIPFIAEFQQAFPGASILVTGVQDKTPAPARTARTKGSTCPSSPAPCSRRPCCSSASATPRQTRKTAAPAARMNMRTGLGFLVARDHARMTRSGTARCPVRE